MNRLIIDKQSFSNVVANAVPRSRNDRFHEQEVVMHGFADRRLVALGGLGHVEGGDRANLWRLRMFGHRGPVVGSGVIG